MKKKVCQRIIIGIGIGLLSAAALCCPCGAAAQEFDAATAQWWLQEFAESLSQAATVNEPGDTADPSRAGQYLLAYEFGTVLSGQARKPDAQDILEIDLRTPQVADCRGLRVGAGLEEALDGWRVDRSSTQLYVLHTQETGIGWSWVYVGEDGVYGVEYITYGGEEAEMTEYTLTYVIGEDATVQAIRMKMAPATQAQAEDGLKMAEEIARRQRGEAVALQNGSAIFAKEDLQLQGKRVLGIEAAQLVSNLGEPQQVQALPAGGGRILLYDGLVAELGLEEYTGVEAVRGVSVSGAGIAGPRGLCVGMSVQEAAALFYCEETVYSVGGQLYLEGEALGEPPYAELLAGEGGEMTLRYVCQDDTGRIAVLEAGMEEGAVSYWHLFYDQGEAEGGI